MGNLEHVNSVGFYLHVSDLDVVADGPGRFMQNRMVLNFVISHFLDD